MKIAFVFDKFMYGGIERVGINHIKILREMGHEVDAYVLSRKNEDMINELKTLCSVKIVPFSDRFCPDIYWKITRRFKIGKYIFSSVYLFFKIILFLIKPFKKQKKKYDVAIAFSGHIADLTFVAYNLIKADKRACWLHGALFTYVTESQGFETLYKRIINLAVLSEDSQHEVIAQHLKDGFAEFNIQKIYNAVDTVHEEINQTNVEELKRKYGNFILMVARCHYPHKDQYTAIKAVQILKEKYGIQRKLVLLGDGPERNKLEQFVKDRNCEDIVVFEGTKNNVQDYYSAASILVHASIFGEGLPTVLIEAMNFGIPVISTDTKTGPHEIIGDNKYGFLCDIQDAEGMAEKLHILLSDNEVYRCYSEQGLARAEDFKPVVIKKQLSDFLANIK